MTWFKRRIPEYRDVRFTPTWFKSPGLQVDLFLGEDAPEPKPNLSKKSPTSSLHGQKNIRQSTPGERRGSRVVVKGQYSKSVLYRRMKKFRWFTQGKKPDDSEYITLY